MACYVGPKERVSFGFGDPMGRVSKDDTVAGIYQAFLAHRTWRQADLARQIGVSTRTLRQRLLELSARSVPLECEEDPPHVYWSVHPSWFPGGVALKTDEAAQLLRELWHLPKSARRNRIVTKILGGLQQRDAFQTADASILAAVMTAAETSQREVIEESLITRAAVRMQYFSAHRGSLEWRHISPVMLVSGPPLRLVARCHRSDELRWFRIDGIVQALVDPGEPLRPTPLDVAKQFIDESANGYHDETPATEHAFFVRTPEANWVARNLLSPMIAEPTPSGIRVRATASGVMPIARFVVGLGAAARAESSPLREVVRELAEGALGSIVGTPIKALRDDASLNAHRVRAIRRGK